MFMINITDNFVAPCTIKFEEGNNNVCRMQEMFKMFFVHWNFDKKASIIRLSYTANESRQ